MNKSLTAFEHRDIFAWLLQVDVFVRNEEGGGFPTDDEADVLNAMEDRIMQQISPRDEKPNALFVARKTDGDLRTIFIAVHDPEMANNGLQELLGNNPFGLPWEFRMEADQEWKAVQTYFEQLSKAEQRRQLH